MENHKLTKKNLSHCLTCKALADQGTAFTGDHYLVAIEKQQQEAKQWFADITFHRCLQTCVPQVHTKTW